MDSRIRCAAPQGSFLKEFTRRVPKVAGSNDKSVSHATLAGTENWNVKYLPNPPTARIAEAHPGRIMTPHSWGRWDCLSRPSPHNLHLWLISPPAVFTDYIIPNGNSRIMSAAY
jgi:hypothetical protein